uniref:Uncharacterized protein n=1 Tax=Avena sativa TaxID=4498 RepID=A0ACD5UCX7_AVESA
MPAALDARRLYIDSGCPDPARRVFVTDSGMIKLICVSDLAGRSVHSRHHPIFKITTWNLSTDNKWEQDATMEASEFQAALASDKRLPLLRPEYPTMSLVDHDVVCFVLNDDRYSVSWLIEVDLNKKVLGAVTLYIHEEEEKQIAEEERANFSSFSDNSFIPSQFTMYLDKRAIKSLSFSKKLEEEKLKRVMEKGQIKDPKQVLV